MAGKDGKDTVLRFTAEDSAGSNAPDAAGKLRYEASPGETARQKLRFEKADVGEISVATRAEAKRAARKAEHAARAGNDAADALQKAADTTVQNAQAVQSGSHAAQDAAAASAGAVSSAIHYTVRNRSDGNTGVEAAESSEQAAEDTARTVRRSLYASKLKRGGESEKLNHRSDSSDAEVLRQRHLSGDKDPASNPLSRWMQKQRLKREYAKAKRAAETAEAASAAGQASAAEAVISGGTAAKTERRGQEVLSNLQEQFTEKKNGWKAAIGCCLVAVLILLQFHTGSLVGGGAFSIVSLTSWQSEDTALTKADAYYTKLEAQLQKKINRTESTHSGSDEYSYSLSEIGHDPVVLTSYLSAKYGDFTFRQVKSELEELFALQYSLDVTEAGETRTETKTVQAGDYIGEVVTSAYCSCSICCGKWAGGTTASGVYPTASHTLAVDASDPIVPIGTQVMMNGILYTVEDTGNLNANGVDFDVYYDSHEAALAHGHQTWDAYYAGGDGEEVEVTITETVDVCEVTLTTTDLEEVVAARMDEDEAGLYAIYLQTGGNRVFFRSPLDYNWHLSITGTYGWRCSGTSVSEADTLDVGAAEGTTVLSVMDGTVKSAARGKVSLSDGNGSIVTLSGLTGISVSAGDEVTLGQEIAEVGSSGTLSISYSYDGTELNPYFYLDTGEGSIYGSDVDATGNAALLIQKAYQYLGVPYVWGGDSPSGFDCSGFVSYCINNCGAGWDVGRCDCNGLLSICTTISASEAQPGDLVFFQGTYSTSGASHVAIYLGDGKIIHAGSPVQVTDMTTSYYQQHFYCFGRLS
ncbi:MAG: NlpC/P60 family protein [Lachnospiraceae bacterium]|nr:NlpC/P60 family protein [Lachnospiraceae bacterium]